MKAVLFLLCFWGSMQANAQTTIQFDHISWQEAKAKAVKEKKLIFIDFYTQWCGPCLIMQKEVFVLNDVAGFFNTTFVNIKVDAEHGEGIELAKKYNVHVYPTYSFIDPATEVLVHESSGRQDKETFLSTAKSASDPSKSSTYLMAQYKAGNNSPQFLVNYATYQASRYNSEEALKTAEKLISMPGYSMENEKVWNLFVKDINGRDNLLAKEFITNTDKYTRIYGKEAVDKKLFALFEYSPDTSVIAAVPEFKGKDYLIKKNESDRLIRAQKYEEAAVIIEGIMAKGPGEFKKEFCQYLYFTGRYAYMNKKTNMPDYPGFWKNKCISYLQYAAYNNPDKENIQLTFAYASLLDTILKSIPEAAKYLPEDFSDPKYGEKTYSNRPPELKQKPSKKAKL